MIILKADNTKTKNHVIYFNNYITDKNSNIKVNKKGDVIKLKKNKQYQLELQGNIVTLPNRDVIIKYSCKDFNPDFSKFCTFQFPNSNNVTVITGTKILIDAKKDISLSIVLNGEYDISNLQLTVF